MSARENLHMTQNDVLLYENTKNLEIESKFGNNHNEFLETFGTQPITATNIMASDRLLFNGNKTNQKIETVDLLEQTTDNLDKAA